MTLFSLLLVSIWRVQLHCILSRWISELASGSTVCRCVAGGSTGKAFSSSEPAHTSPSFSMNQFSLWILSAICLEIICSFFFLIEGNKGLGGGIDRKGLLSLAALLVCHLRMCMNCTLCHTVFFTS